MSDSIEELERDIEESRARLDETIDRIQDRLSVSGLVDDVVGSVRDTQFGSVVDHALEIVRRNPLPVLLIAAGVGWLMVRMAQDGRRSSAYRAEALEEESVPILNIGQARIYDPDMPTRHPTQDVLDTRRELAARA
jgi:ElaB/YqjD/DUF883 family membrane-anchored ribosome-binding protein